MRSFYKSIFVKSTKLMKKIRLFVNQEQIKIGDQLQLQGNDFDYLIKVMRLKMADKVFVFNGVDGEFACEIVQLNKKDVLVSVIEKTADCVKAANITLAFCPVKNVKNDFIAMKATELGISKIRPIISQRTIVDKINTQRFRINIKEACEQCERNDVPEIFEIEKLDKFLAQHHDDIVILCDESGQGKKASQLLPELQVKPEQEIIIVIGPEGGFAPAEFDRMRQLPYVYSMSLGPRILRADTAMFCALALVQEFLGDF